MRKALILGALIGGCVFTSCSEKKTETKQDVISVKTMTVKAGSGTGSFNQYIGTVEEIEGAEVTFNTMGTVTKVHVREGQMVRQGQVLASLNTVQAQNAYDIASSQLRQAEDAYKRYEILHNQQSLPEVKWVEIQSKVETARAQERMARKSLDDCVIRAPFSGYVAKKNIDAGSSAGPGLAGIKVVKIDRVYVSAGIPEKDVSMVKIGTHLSFTVDALKNKEFTGVIKERGVEASPMSHTYQVRVEVANPQHELLPGMVAKAKIDMGDMLDLIVVPQSAVMLDARGLYVWKVVGGLCKRQSVESDDVVAGGAVITSGLQNGDVVITSGMEKVSEDKKVKAI